MPLITDDTTAAGGKTTRRTLQMLLLVQTQQLRTNGHLLVCFCSCTFVRVFLFVCFCSWGVVGSGGTNSTERAMVHRSFVIARWFCSLVLFVCGVFLFVGSIWQWVNGCLI